VSHRRAPRALAAAFIVVAGLAASPSPSSAAAVACDRYAARTGSDTAAGTLAAPFKTAQKLVNSLSAGQTGCLGAGTYDEQTGDYVVRFGKGGTAGAPIRLTSVPGERAKLRGVVYVPSAAPNVVISDLDIDGRQSVSTTSAPPVGVQIMSADVVFERNDVTNGQVRSCMILGNNGGYGQAIRPIVRQNRFHDCGNPANNGLDHSIYIENAADTEIVDNIFWNSAAFAVQIYPNSQRTLVHHNVMDGNGRGIVFGGDSAHASSGNVVEQNVISNSFERYNVESWWGGAVGSGNIARDNCLYNGKLGQVADQWGFTATANLTADPGYSNRTVRDYRMALDSPCLAKVGYDTARKLEGELPPVTNPTPAQPQPAPATPAPTVPAPAPAPAPAPPVVTPPAPLNAAPSVALTSPGSGATFVNTLRMTASAADDSAVTRVEFFVDGVRRGTDTTAPYSASFTATKNTSYGSHTVTVKAFDAAGQVASKSVTVKRVRSTTARIAKARAAARKAAARRVKQARAARTFRH
jgi:hypothetical protein